MTLRLLLATTVALLSTTGCPKNSGEGSTTTPPPSSNDPQTLPPSDGAARPSLTAEECEGKGGTIVGDIGDGAIHRPDYTCESGQPPIGDITAPEGGPIAVEGSVCCPAAS
ncbi:hypothetical protein [Paraliomyxa miuraensis]|uniref:hypothetical protein n=1 Tax=Paraliomyxa miuraensis TaxID=376150 RepID=UPI002251E4A9|nr:hypothetical protein [Paraliomyxa miuraensis]MCX4247509.1 hypothetical protein [Paraliomyxa miuraensis]